MTLDFDMNTLTIAVNPPNEEEIESALALDFSIQITNDDKLNL